MDPHKRIEELETEVQRLTELVEQLSVKKRSRHTAQDIIHQATHRWLVLAWAALILLYASHYRFLLHRPPDLPLNDMAYFWLSNGFLALCCFGFLGACVYDIRKTGASRPMVAPLVFVNLLAFFLFTSAPIHMFHAPIEWMFRLAFAAILLCAALLTETAGSRRNYLFEVLVVMTVSIFTLALSSLWSDGPLWVAIALESLLLALIYRVSGIVLLKVLSVGLILITLIGDLFFLQNTGAISIGPWTMQTNWFGCAGVATAFVATACFYEHFAPRIKPAQRLRSGQWFLAGTAFDIHQATLALFHAAAAALVLLTTTIIDQGDQPLLPFILCAEGIAMALAGFVLRTPQLEVASVLLVASAHVCHHAFYHFPLKGFDQQPGYVPYTLLLAAFTFVGANFWERYLSRVQLGRNWEHDAIVALPYLAATFMLAMLLAQHLGTAEATLALNAIGLILLLAACLTPFAGMKASGLLAFGMGTMALLQGIFVLEKPIQAEPAFLPYLLLALATYIAAERLCVPHKSHPREMNAVLRTLFVFMTALLGAAGLALWDCGVPLVIRWLILAAVMLALGALLREIHYRWAAALVLLAAITRALIWHLLGLPLLYQILSFSLFTAVFLVGIGLHAHGKRNHSDSRDAGNTGAPSANG